MMMRPTRDDDPPVIGNERYQLALRNDGRVGFWRSRANSRNPEVNCELNLPVYSSAILHVLKHVLSDLARLKNSLSDETTNVAETLSRGILVMTYLKLRAINLFRPSEVNKFEPKPKVHDLFEVPEPYAVAISHLGVVEVTSLPKRVICYPTATTVEANNYLLTRKTDWSQSDYFQAVRYAKDLGMRFSSVDLDVKVGSSWWLFKPRLDDGGLLSIRCILPEDNYTLPGAVVYSLFCKDLTHGPANQVFNLANLEDADYGSYIRTKRHDFCLECYYGISSQGS